MTFSTKGTKLSAIPRRTSLGSVCASTRASSRMKSGGAVTRLAIAARKSSCFEPTWRRTAAGVTPSSAAISASVAPSNPLPRTPPGRFQEVDRGGCAAAGPFVNERIFTNAVCQAPRNEKGRRAAGPEILRRLRASGVRTSVSPRAARCAGRPWLSAYRMPRAA